MNNDDEKQPWTNGSTITVKGLLSDEERKQKKQQFDDRVTETKARLERLKLRRSDLLHLAAVAMERENDCEKKCTELGLSLFEEDLALKALNWKEEGHVYGDAFLKLYAEEENNKVAIALLKSAVVAKKQQASKNALTNHPAHAKRQQVIVHWREHIYPSHPKLSNERTAEWLKDTFPELSFRKLSQYVSQAKKEMKEMCSAGKA